LDGTITGIPAAVRINLATELARLDVATSTRLAASAYTAPPTVGAIRTEMEVNGGKLDHLWETTVDSGGTRRFTAAALALAPTGSGGGGTGAGARTVVITVDDGTVVLESARVRLTKGAETYIDSTNEDGQVTFNIDDGTWTVAISLPGYTFAGDELIVADDVNETFTLTRTVITPSIGQFTTGYLTVLDQEGLPEEAAQIKLVVREVPSSVAGLAFDGQTRTEVSDAAGLVEFANLVKGVTYSMQRGTSKKSYLVTIPADAGDTYPLPSIIGQE
jgi:hypothetical protein